MKRIFLLSSSLALFALRARAQTPVGQEPEANPGRPTVSTPATLTPAGYLQFETGLSAANHSPEFSSRFAPNEVLKFSVHPRLESPGILALGKYRKSAQTTFARSCASSLKCAPHFAYPCATTDRIVASRYSSPLYTAVTTVIFGHSSRARRRSPSFTSKCATLARTSAVAVEVGVSAAAVMTLLPGIAGDPLRKATKSRTY